MSRHGEPETAPEQQQSARHAAPDGAEVHPLIDLSRDPHPGVPDHAAPDED
jgi:hypothetical protein